MLDDFGLQAGTQLNDQTLLYIVTTCQKLRIPLIVITHHSPDELMAAGKDGKPPVLVSHIRRCALDFNVIMPAARRRRMYEADAACGRDRKCKWKRKWERERKCKKRCAGAAGTAVERIKKFERKEAPAACGGGS